MKAAKLILSSILLLTIAGLTQAQGISYNYGEVRYLDSEVGARDGDGIEIAGSYQIDPEWLVLGSYSSQDYGDNLNGDVIELGVGHILPAVNGVELVGTASVVSSEFGDDDENGIKLTALARTEFTAELEGRASVNYLKVDDGDLFVELGADYFFSPQISAGAEVQLGSNTDTISIGVRWYYDR